MPNSRGIAVSAYIPAFSKGAKIYGANIQSGVITSAHIADGTVVAADVAAGSITSAKLGTGAVVEVKIGAGAVTSAKIGAAAVKGANIAAGVITSAHIADGTVLAAEIAAGAVTSAKIGTGAVVAIKIGAQAVTSAKIKAAFLSGTLVSGQITKAIAHGLGAKPKMVVVTPILTLAQAISAKTVGSLSATFRIAPTISLAAASAATSTNFYVIGSQGSNQAIKYVAYVQL